MWLTKPTRARVALWLVLAFLWFLFLPQYLADDTPHKHFSGLGAVFWAVVLAWLLRCAWMTSRRYRARRGAGQAPEAR
jgi:threonine/homoserine/homoserine lactone efflux protein